MKKNNIATNSHPGCRRTNVPPIVLRHCLILDESTRPELRNILGTNLKYADSHTGEDQSIRA